MQIHRSRVSSARANVLHDDDVQLQTDLADGCWDADGLLNLLNAEWLPNVVVNSQNPFKLRVRQNRTRIMTIMLQCVVFLATATAIQIFKQYTIEFGGMPINGSSDSCCTCHVEL